MQFQKKEKRQTTVRFDSHHVRLRTGEIQRKTGSYMYRWTDKLGKRNTIYAATLEDLREQEEQILVDQPDGIKANIKKEYLCKMNGITYFEVSANNRLDLADKIKRIFREKNIYILSDSQEDIEQCKKVFLRWKDKPQQ